MPSGPVQGTEGVQALISGFIGPAEKVDWEIITIAQSGDTIDVMHFETVNGGVYAGVQEITIEEMPNFTFLAAFFMQETNGTKVMREIFLK